MAILTTAAGLLLLGLVVLIVLILILVYLRGRAVRTIKPPKPPDISTGAYPDLSATPRYEDLISGEEVGQGYSAQLQTDTYNLRIEAIDENQVRFIVNGIAYPSIDEIPETELRKTAKKLLDKTFQSGTSEQGHEILRQVVVGNQSTIEAKGPAYNISIQQQGSQNRFIVNGMTYYSLNDIPDPDMRKKARELLGKIV